MEHVNKERIWSERFEDTPKAQTATEEIAHTLGVSKQLAVLLYNRGYRTAEAAGRFLRFETADFYDPFLLKDADIAVARIDRAIENKEKIYIYGDYDVDGVTSVTMLYLYLTGRGADVGIKIPKRDGEGYGVSAEGIDSIAADGATLIITVDTGITALDEVAYAESLGVDVIVTDHHECRPELPPACAVVNPHRPDCSYPFSDLAGVGVVFKLVCACEMTLCRKQGEPVINGVRRICAAYADLAAIGTIADVMPLTDENRLIVGMGLRLIERTERPGLAALIEAASPSSKDGSGETKKRKISSGFIGFGIAPRINAAGRISDAVLAVKLLLADDPAEAKRSADELCEINRRRQIEENKIAEEAYDMIERTYVPERDRVIVLDHDGWQQGIIGIVSSRITEKYGLPSILISYGNGESAEKDGMDLGKGSGRSIKGMNLVGALSHCEDLLEKFGGHELAAGLTIRRANVEAFRKKLNEYALQSLDESAFCVHVEADCELSLRELTLPFAEELLLLEPYGVGNPTPSFVSRDVTVQRIMSIGGGRHTKLILEKSGVMMSGMYFGVSASELSFDVGDRIDVMYQVDINDYRNVRTVQMLIKDVRASESFERSITEGRVRYEEIRAGATFTEREDIVPDRDDFATVYTALRKEYRCGTTVMDAKTLLRLVNQGDTRPIPYVKLRYILEIMNELEICRIEQMGSDIFHFEIEYKAGKTNIEKSSILKKLKGRCIDRTHH